MTIEWKLEDDNLAVFNISGKLGKAEYDQILSEIESAIEKVGDIKILVLLEDFTGWEKAKGWEDASFADRNDVYIKRFAIVGDEKWRDLVSVFTLKGLRPVPIEYFSEGKEQAARQWLSED